MPAVDRIFIASGTALPMQSVQSVVVTAKGLKGDRYAIGKGSFSGQRQNVRDVTLISVNDIRESNSTLSVPFTPAETRRNIVIAGKISLLDYIGRDFTIGNVTLRGTEEASPCRHAERVAKKSGFLKAFKHRAGIRAEVIHAGHISVGDEVRLVSQTDIGVLAAE